MTKFIRSFMQDRNIESKLVAVLAATIYIIIHITISYLLKPSFFFPDFDECYNSLCQNGGTCINTDGDYRCECNYGYTGKNCHLGKEKSRTVYIYT